VTYGKGEDPGATRAKRGDDDARAIAREDARHSRRGRTRPEGTPPSPTSGEVHRAAGEKIVEERADIENDAPTARRGAPPEGGER
jgi:hypothetical protein